jgi:tRNA1Val (adenine37-N6)-methyltransferase
MFHFKQFSIDDSKAAMKIGTDAVLLGAWTPCNYGNRILDIGTGSGILTIMMAQRNPDVEIDAVEIDPDATAQAKLNAQLSPWNDRIHIFNLSVQEFSLAKMNSYNLIICNPPFFTNSLKAPDNKRNLARHNNSLPVEDLLESTSKMLTEDGKAVFIIPANTYETWKREAAKHQLFPDKITWVKSSPANAPHRVMVVFSRKNQDAIPEDEICIYSSEKIHSQAYKEITKDFYLKF